MAKEEIAQCEQFLLLTQCFPKFSAINVSACGKWLIYIANMGKGTRRLFFNSVDPDQPVNQICTVQSRLTLFTIYKHILVRSFCQILEIIHKME